MALLEKLEFAGRKSLSPATLDGGPGGPFSVPCPRSGNGLAGPSVAAGSFATFRPSGTAGRGGTIAWAPHCRGGVWWYAAGGVKMEGEDAWILGR